MLSDMRVLDLFSGIGGISLGLEWAGMETVAFCEMDPWCRSRLRQHWPGLPVYRDVKHVGSHSTRALGRIDLVAGGFPCQDISAANPKGKGLDGERSGLAFEMLRIIRELRPAWCLFENSPNLRTRGADQLLLHMEEQGYTCWPLVVGARHVAAPHRRDRAWVVAYARDAERGGRRQMGRRLSSAEGAERGRASSAADTSLGGRDGTTWNPSLAEQSTAKGSAKRSRTTSDPDRDELRQQPGRSGRTSRRGKAEHPDIDDGRNPPDTTRSGRQAEGRRGREVLERAASAETGGRNASHAHGHGQSTIALDGQVGRGQSATGADAEPWGWWNLGPGTHLRLDDGLPTKVARRHLSAYGNSVVPQVVAAIGRAIMITAAAQPPATEDGR